MVSMKLQKVCYLITAKSPIENNNNCSEQTKFSLEYLDSLVCLSWILLNSFAYFNLAASPTGSKILMASITNGTHCIQYIIISSYNGVMQETCSHARNHSWNSLGRILSK